MSLEKQPRISLARPRTDWRLPIGAAVGLHLGLLAVGSLNRHDTLLDLIAKGEIEAVVPADPQPAPVQEVELVDLTPPPPPEQNPEFIVPQEVPPPDPLDDLSDSEETDSLPTPVPPPPLAVAAPAPVPPAPTPALAAVSDAASATAAVAPSDEEAFAPSGVKIGNRDFPKPPYPYEAKLRRYQGVVVVSLNIVGGVIVDAGVENSSGYGILDRSAVSWIRRTWHFPSEVTRTLTQPINFELADGAS